MISTSNNSGKISTDTGTSSNSGNNIISNNTSDNTGGSNSTGSNRNIDNRKNVKTNNNNNNSNHNIRGRAVRCNIELGIRPPIRWHTLAPMLPVMAVVPVIHAILTAPRGRTLGIQQIPIGFLVKNEIANTCYDNTKFLKE